MQVVQSVDLEMSGPTGDHARAGKRALTLFQHEHLPSVAAYLGLETVAPNMLRRNIHISSLNLSALKEVPLRIGRAVIKITIVCAPCSRMHETFGPGGYNALRGHGGWCAEILEPGRVDLHDRVMRA